MINENLAHAKVKLNLVMPLLIENPEEIIVGAVFPKRIQLIHTNVTADIMNVFACQCHSPLPACTPSPRLFKMYFIHRLTVLVVYLIIMTA